MESGDAVQVQRLQRVQAGSAELLFQRDAKLRRLRREALIAEKQHGARARAVDGMREAVAAAGAGTAPHSWPEHATPWLRCAQQRIACQAAYTLSD